METLNKCPLCGSSSVTTILESQDFFLSNEPFSISQCKECGLQFTNPRPEKESLGKYYDSKEYISHDTQEKNLLNILYTTARTFSLKRKVRLAKMNSSGNTILDIGCGTGEFLHECAKSGFNTTGIEPNEKAAAFARAVHKIKVYSEDFLRGAPPVSFDLITLWHVLEHVPDLNERMSTIKRLLKDSGTLIIAVPNAGSKDAAHYGRYWAAYDLPRHLYHFTMETMNELIKRHDLKVVRILPMKLDAFYISLLSEKYARGKQDYFSAFANGIRFNLTASKDYGYSSLIYIVKKEKP
jgi:2-polyprenyl-3-methyl-5-hydroxy-6-metoxy-1,4-benzoquinol methylase